MTTMWDRYVDLAERLADCAQNILRGARARGFSVKLYLHLKPLFYQRFFLFSLSLSGVTKRKRAQHVARQ